MPELGAIETRPPQASPVSLPIAPESECKQGKRFIQGGRAGLREAL
jgi:hypothetical protein